MGMTLGESELEAPLEELELEELEELELVEGETDVIVPEEGETAEGEREELVLEDEREEELVLVEGERDEGLLLVERETDEEISLSPSISCSPEGKCRATSSFSSSSEKENFFHSSGTPKILVTLHFG